MDKLYRKIALIGLAVIAVLAICLVFSIKSCNKNKYDVDRLNRNIAAMNDTIKFTKSKYDSTLVAQRMGFEASYDELALLNQKLQDELDKLGIPHSGIIGGSHAGGVIELPEKDTAFVEIHDTIIKNHGFARQFDFSDEWRELAGTARYAYGNGKDTLGVSIDRDVVKFDYTVAMDKNNQIYVHSNNPYVKFNELSGFIVPEKSSYIYKRKKFNIGPYVGYGYDIVKGKFNPQIGIGLTYSLFGF